MKSTLLLGLLLTTAALSACQKTEPAPPPVIVTVPGPAGATGATGATGTTGSTGSTGATGGDTTVIVVPSPAASAASQ